MKRKILAIILCIGLAFTLAGCNSTELEAYQIIRSIFNMDTYEFDGIMQLDLNKMPPIFDDYDDPSEADWGTFYVEYSGIVSEKNNILSLAIDVYDEEDTALFDCEIILEDKTIYLKSALLNEVFEDIGLDTVTINSTEYYTANTDDILELIKTIIINNSFPIYAFEAGFDYHFYIPDGAYSNEYMNGFDFGFTDGFYDGFDELGELFSFNDTAYGYSTPEQISDYKDGYADGYDIGYEVGVGYKTEVMANIAQVEAQFEVIKENFYAANIIRVLRSISVKAFDEIVYNLFENFELDIVTKDEYKYSVSLDEYDIYEAGSETLGYLNENLELVAETIEAILLSLTDDELALFGLSTEDLEGLLPLMIGEIVLFPDFGDDPGDMTVEDVLEAVDLNLDFGVELLDDSNYDINSSLEFVFTSPEDENIVIFDIAITNTLNLTRIIDIENGSYFEERDLIIAILDDPFADLREIFAHAKEFSKEIGFKVGGDAYSWSFNGADLGDIPELFNLAISFEDDETILSKLPDNVNPLVLSFAYSGELPGEATIKINVSDMYEDGETIELYFYNPETEELELVYDDLVVENGLVTFTLTHCSDYVLVGYEEDVPTGDNAVVYVFTVLISLAAAAFVFNFKKKLSF